LNINIQRKAYNTLIFEEDNTPILVRLKTAPSVSIQFPRNLAHLLIHRRLAAVVGNFNALPDLIVEDAEAQDLILAL
jgi:hypothetical protein